jgi:hypothetical protein
MYLPSVLTGGVLLALPAALTVAIYRKVPGNDEYRFIHLLGGGYMTLYGALNLIYLLIDGSKIPWIIITWAAVWQVTTFMNIIGTPLVCLALTATTVLYCLAAARKKELWSRTSALYLTALGLYVNLGLAGVLMY